LKEKLITLLIGEVGLDSTQVDKHSKALKIGDMMERGGGGGRQAIRRRRAPAGSSNFSIRHADWESD
jgi:hypothetical protein